MTRVALVTCRELRSEHGDVYQAFPAKLIKLLNGNGYTVIAVPNASNQIEKLLMRTNPALIVLTGGENFGENEDRDHTEDAILKFALKNPNIIVFGICRGMQLIATQFGGELGPVENHIGVDHTINGNLYSGNVNSYHANQIISLPNELLVTARSEDGVIEAIKHISLPWIGWMWHPERDDMPSWMEKAFSEAVNK